MRDKNVALGVWLLAMVGCAILAAFATLRTDMAAFLPRSASAAQLALTGQVNGGAASRLVLLAIEGAPPPVLAALSRNMAERLRGEPDFIDIANGDDASFADARRFIWGNRYLLAPDVTAARFMAAGLRVALQGDLDLLATDMGTALAGSLPSDPTDELLALTGPLETMPGPKRLDGVWISEDGARALLLIHTKAPGFDLDAQQRALRLIGDAFARARTAVPAAGAARLAETGPGVFGVAIRDTTKADVKRLSLLATLVVASLLSFTYRSPRLLLLGLLPVANGALAAVAAVSLDFGFVHGVTLGFGVTLIGEASDYAIYLFTQTAPGETARDTLTRIWPTLRLGAATSVLGFGAMLFSSFIGFAQLGLFSVTGLIVAACFTRFVLPHLMPAGFVAKGSGVWAGPALLVIAHRRWLRAMIAAAVLAAGAALAGHRGGFWDPDLDDLSPVPPAAQALDRVLRHDLGVPDLRYFVLVAAGCEQQALERSEALAPVLQNLVAAGQIDGFELPSTTLPSAAAQRRRQAALPDAATLLKRFDAADSGLPFRAGAFAPFFAAVAQARTAPLVTEADLPPALALRLQNTLVRSKDGWTVVTPLFNVADPGRVATALAGAGLAGLHFIDIDRESNRLLQTFEHDALLLAEIGSLAVLAVLLVGLRAPARAAAVAMPLLAAVVVTAAVLTAGGGKASIFMVVGFLLIVALGSNYCLFFERQERDPARRQRTLGAIVLANLCTVSTYGLMSFSHIPVLHDIGRTVALGTFLSLLFGAALSTPDRVA